MASFVDEIKIHIRAGRGGDGVVRWRHEKGKDKAGAAGGNGGRGGDVFVRGVKNFNILAKYKHLKEFAAGDGGHGQKSSMNGKAGGDLVIDLPVGSSVNNLSTKKTIVLLKAGQINKILDGGRGGLGNEHFKASTNVRPKESTPGKPGEEVDFYVELALTADAGFVGLPNAGKSSLLNALTNASSEVGSYAFTTLDPHLGPFFGFVLADIPGLISGASKGKGLGHKFLRHITRTSLILHCVSVEDEDVTTAYKIVRDELRAYDPLIAQKPEIVILTKIDTMPADDVMRKQEELAKFLRGAVHTVARRAVKGIDGNAVREVFNETSAEIMAVSIHDPQSLKKVGQTIINRLKS